MYDLGVGEGRLASKLQNERIQFFKASTNSGGHYNITSGEYTCAVTGIYFFSLTLGSELRISARIGTGNGYLLEIDRYDPDSHLTLSSSAVYACTAGEKIFVDAAHDATFRNWLYNNVFSGFLIT